VFQFPDNLSTEGFLDRHWQKAPLFMPQALPAGLPELDADELAWLATQSDVESRLIFTERDGATTSYRVEHGPFDDKTLAALAPQYWTLLVQDVEKHLPDFRSFVRTASFIPDWRIDDLMISFAAPGGSVGPHRDNYDVFLCQGAGRREWRIAPANAKLKAIEYGELSLLEEFTDDSPVKARHADILYLPPGIAHWGIAEDSCMTYSIGMRAPTLPEFLAGVARMQDSDIDHEGIDDVFYTDADLVVSESEPGLISARSLERARQAFARHSSLTDEEIAAAFGSVVTDVKAWLAPEEPGQRRVREFLASGTKELRVHGMARLAFCATADQHLVFANGHGKSVDADHIGKFRGICADRMAQTSDDDLFRWLLAHGAFDLQSDEQDDVT
jgi:50S ribosomal protein L16 3-hydroxylase